MFRIATVGSLAMYLVQYSATTYKLYLHFCSYYVRRYQDDETGAAKTEDFLLNVPAPQLLSYIALSSVLGFSIELYRRYPPLRARYNY